MASSSNISGLPRKTPAKRCRSVIPLSDEVRRIILEQTGQNYKTSEDLPSKFNLSSGDIKDVSALGHVQTLHLWVCTEITDVSALGGVQHLDLSWCTGVTDVSALSYVRDLNLIECTGITDVSALGHVEKLTLSSTEITDVSALGGV